MAGPGPGPGNARTNVKCPECKHAFKTPHEFFKHRPSCPGSIDSLPCDFCKKIFWTDKGLQAHMTSVHGPNGMQPSSIFPGLGEIERREPQPWPYNQMTSPSPLQMGMGFPPLHPMFPGIWPLPPLPFPPFQQNPYPLEFNWQVGQGVYPPMISEISPPPYHAQHQQPSYPYQPVNPPFYWQFGFGENPQAQALVQNMYPAAVTGIPTTRSAWKTQRNPTKSGPEKDKTFKCSICFKKYKTENGLMKHSPCAAPIFLLKFQCELCPRAFNSEAGLLVHRSETHGQWHRFGFQFQS